MGSPRNPLIFFPIQKVSFLQSASDNLQVFGVFFCLKHSYLLMKSILAKMFPLLRDQLLLMPIIYSIQYIKIWQSSIFQGLFSGVRLQSYAASLDLMRLISEQTQQPTIPVHAQWLVVDSGPNWMWRWPISRRWTIHMKLALECNYYIWKFRISGARVQVWERGMLFMGATR